MAKKFTPIIDRPHPNMPDGTQQVYRFDNDYGASVVRTSLSYGGDRGLFELAVLKFDGEHFHITYDTSITDDVRGHLTSRKVNNILVQIRALP